MLSLHTNAAALSAQSSISKTQQSLSTSMTRLSTGYRINSAMDDAAGLQIATRLKAQTSGMAMAMRNTQNATSMIQTADGALGETVNILVRMKDLATQAADGSATTDDKAAMQAEFDTLSAELTNIVGNTSFGGAKLLTGKASGTDVSAAAGLASTAQTNYDTQVTLVLGTTKDGLSDGLKFAHGVLVAATAPPTAPGILASSAQTLKEETAKLADLTKAKNTADAYSTAAAISAGASVLESKFGASVDFQIGASSGEKMTFNLTSELGAMHTALRAATAEYNSFGAAMAAKGTELTGVGTASSSINKLQAAIDAVGTTRSALGAAGNRLDHVATNLANVSTNTQGASGRIMDTDFATESSNMTASQMLLQAGTAMLKQSNSMSSMVMSLLQ